MNSNKWHKTPYTSLTLEIPTQHPLSGLQKESLECLMHWERNSEQRTTTPLYLYPVSTYRPVTRASPGKQGMCGIRSHKGDKSRCPTLCQDLGWRERQLSRKDGIAQRRTSGSFIQSNTPCAAFHPRKRKKFRQALCPVFHTDY